MVSISMLKPPCTPGMRTRRAGSSPPATSTRSSWRPSWWPGSGPTCCWWTSHSVTSTNISTLYLQYIYIISTHLDPTDVEVLRDLATMENMAVVCGIPATSAHPR